MAKNDKFYFENFIASTALSRDAAYYLVNCLENFEPENIQQMLREMHSIEHNADMKKHEMGAALAKAFVTPVDREDLDLLSHKLDDVADEIEEVLQRIYIYNITTIEPAAIELAKKIAAACEVLCELMEEFENFKRSKKIKELIIKINDAEEECDNIYLKSMHELTKNPTDFMHVLSWRSIYDRLERCADACEHVSECVSTVIMKNT